MEKQKFDIGIVGGGIIGLAHAYSAIKRGYRVIQFEKDQKTIGASIRNFGLIWPIGQPAGKLFNRAMRSREIWLELSEKAGFWALNNGSIHLAYNKDEQDVLDEYHEKFGYKTKLLKPGAVQQYSPHIVTHNLKGGLYSETEINVNPKEAIYSISKWLQTHDNYVLKTGEKVQNVDDGRLESTRETYFASKIYVCSGSDFQSLYGTAFEESNLIKSKLQMLRSISFPEEFSLGPTLCGGLTLRHYASFEQCSSLGKLKDRFSNQMPEYDKWGIHVMVAQNQFNELVIGDSHEYGQTFDPFDKKKINDLILSYMRKFLNIEKLKISETWHGIYAKNPGKTEFVYKPEKNVKVLTGFGGAGMTFSFGFAEEEIEKI